ncbi:MAG: hypothetical protein ACYTG6_00930 [Planctomycetota bacterium]
MTRRLATVAFLSLLLFAAPSMAWAEDEEQPAAESAVEFLPGPPAFEEVLARAKAEGKPIFLDFFTEW